MPELQLVERKVCEGYACGAMFWRPVPRTARDGEKLCDRCRERERRAAQRALDWARQVRVLHKAS